MEEIFKWIFIFFLLLYCVSPWPTSATPCACVFWDFTVFSLPRLPNCSKTEEVYWWRPFWHDCEQHQFIIPCPMCLSVGPWSAWEFGQADARKLWRRPEWKGESNCSWNVQCNESIFSLFSFLVAGFSCGVLILLSLFFLYMQFYLLIFFESCYVIG